MNIFPYLLAVRAARRRWLVSGSGADLQAWYQAWQALEEAGALAADSRRATAARAHPGSNGNGCAQPRTAFRPVTQDRSRAGTGPVQAPAEAAPPMS